MRTVQELSLTPIWLNPGHLAVTAGHVIRGHGVRAIAVLDDQGLVGVVTEDALRAAPGDALVGDLVLPSPVVLEADTPIRKAAEQFVEHDLTFAPVYDAERFLGLVTSNMLLRELGRSWDPLTGLSWSDVLREWGIARLRAGQEIGILFIDLNDFGQYNKTHGHIVGDRVLRGLADCLRAAIDSETDVLVRYGGDEFAIGTLRDQDSARAWAAELRRRVEDIALDDVAEPVSVTIGMSGGKRTRERENVHYAATLDALINLASRECQAQKAKPEPPANRPNPVVPRRVEAPPARKGARPAVLAVSADENAPEAPATVLLYGQGQVVTGIHLRRDKALTEAVAIATAVALSRLYDGAGVVVDEIHLIESPESGKTVAVSGRAVDGYRDVPFTGTQPVGTDLLRAVAEATVDGFMLNRPMPAPSNGSH